MKIKEIDLTGFKSFGEKTTLELHDGITCIVGPNGCGKSNVVDAFRWVLGEQSAKSLRGEKMEEVIFQGSASKKSKGMAEVRLNISTAIRRSMNDQDDDGAEALHDKIEVARRLYRSGESEYILNKKPCRLKDIKDLFLDTGLDVKSYSILDQGKISEIINTKPIDRRFLIEEVAGVMKYKVRKAEAMSKLNSSKENLLRINDITVEVKRQINSLDRLAKKAERYKRLLDEFKEHDLRIAKREHTRLGSMLAELNTEIERLREDLSAKRSELSTLENNLSLKRIEILEKEKLLAELESRLAEKARLISDSERELAVLRNVIENKRTEIARLRGFMEELEAKKVALAAKAVELEEASLGVEAGLNEIAAELKIKQQAAAVIEGAITEKETELEAKRKDLFRISDSLSHSRNELNKLQSSLETIAYRETTALRDKEGLGKGLAEAEHSISEINSSIVGKKAEIAGLQNEKEAMLKSIASLRDEIENKKLELSRSKEELAANTSRLSSLMELIVDKSLHEFLAESEESRHLSPAILSNIISAKKEYEVAVEAALSEKINSLIIEKAEDIFSAIGIINEKSLGKTAMLFTDLCTASADSAAAPADAEGLIGRASEFVTFEDSRAGSVAKAVLGNVFIARELSNALELRRDARYHDITFVTLAGEVLSSDGFIMAGKGKDILKRKREIRELEEDIKARQASIALIEESINSSQQTAAARQEQLKNTEAAIINLEKEISLYAHSVSGKNEEIERMRRRLTFLETELNTISTEKASLDEVMSVKGEEIAALDIKKNGINDEIAARQEALAAVRAEYETHRTMLEGIKTSMAASKEKLESIKKERAGVAEAADEIELKKLTSEDEIKAAELKIADSGLEIDRIDAAAKLLVAEADEIEKERAERREVISVGNAELMAQDDTLKAMRSVIEMLAEDLSGKNTSFAENRVRIENIQTTMSQKYGLEIAAAEIVTEGFDPEEDDKKAAELNDALLAMGPVNVGAIEEYEELKTRYDFLTKQQQDLTLSIAEIEEAISKINATTKKMLRDAYDALREKFQQVFNTLFGGGKADIILTEEDNILEAGLDIIAQPPGKKLQNINLLSGGEKALTSVALLFAGFLIKPSPLCILDEADAPLDESNTVRFAQMIRNLSTETQFIVITHNRTTMEAADYIYGITMEEPGVSKAISLRFSETEKIVAA